ncbi:uncharacterized protein LOC110091838 [Dendrobium catenatum]|uniref:uncharacterized protein LOC110091838 n=1 Tax=Dendrobium catenatum TaxID=906689 RepID=UPI0009F3CF6F|nr:uncharacterized protein LOC110091838 [Dendrobium catenatum]
MVDIMPRIISEEQAAFVRGRSISDHLLLAQEVFNKLRFSKSCNGFLEIKVDMEQAYYSMCWSTLERMLIELGFPSRFVHLVMECIIDPIFSIVINGSNFCWIEGKSGFLQGCPLSPFLFILCSQLLSNAFRSRGTEVGIKISDNAQRISHLLFADDILLFLEAKVNVMKKVRKIIKDCCRWTGQNINYHKSSLVCGNSVDRRRKVQISRFIGIKLIDEFKYLGINLAMRRLRKADFQGLLDKCCKKIKFWGNRFVSFAGRLVLVKSVYLSLPIFIMTHSLIPMKTLMELEKICRYFIWNKYDGKRELHYMAWEQVCKPKEYGGWDVHSAVARRDAMRAKFSWKLIDKPESLLSRHLNDKYGANWWNYRLYGRSSCTWKILFSERNAHTGSMLDGELLMGLLEPGETHQFFGVDLMDLIYNYKNMDGVVPFSRVYKLKLNARLEVFLWRLFSDALPSGAFLFRRKLADNSFFPMGCEVLEDINHISSSCCKLRKVLDVLRGWGFQIPVFSGWFDCLEGLQRLKNARIDQSGNYESGVGGIVRDCKGRFLLAFGRKKTHWDIAQLEMSAISALTEVLHGIFDGVEGIIVEGDNKNVIDILHKVHIIPKNMDR